jgi:exodeoxyribonuclease V alpha subunit
MKTIDDVHQQFAAFFNNEILAPYAYLLSKKLQEGHICIHKNDPSLNSNEIPYPPPFDAAGLDSIGQLVGGNKDIRPFILHKDQLYLHRYFSYESAILNKMGALIKSEIDLQVERKNELKKIAGLVAALQANYPINSAIDTEPIDWQLIAAVLGVLHNFFIITGGPGTGKTTTVAKILSLLLTIQPDIKIALAAPTGKAAMRLAESLKQTSLPVSQQIKDRFKQLKPNTIHRLLNPIADSIYFKHNQSNPLAFDVVIVDEASMIDVALFAKLIDAIGPDTRLILLGDKNQLASVEAGSMFGDLCKAQDSLNQLSQESGDFVNQFINDQDRKITDTYLTPTQHPLSEHIIELQRSHRFTSTGGIGKFSHAIINNDQAVLKQFILSNNEPAVLIDTNRDNILFESFINGYREYLLEPDITIALQKLNQIRVLCAVREGAQGIYAVNRAIESFLSKQNLIDPKDEYYENRPIIVTRNFNDLALYNGDIGIVRKDNNGNMRAWFEDSDKNLRSVVPGYITGAETVFAMTIHKSQGSEYNQVLVILPASSGSQLLTRELLYTAVTRAKEKVIVQSTENILLETAKGSVKRASGIIHRFEEIQ